MSILEVCKCGYSMDLIDINLWCCPNCGKTIGLKTEKKPEKEDSDQIFF